MKARVVLACLAATSLVACTPRTEKPKFNAAAAVDAIRTGEVHWNADWKSGDAGKVAAHYAPDAVLMVPGVAPMAGLEAIRAGAEQSMDDPGFALTFSSEKVDVAASGDLAVSRGAFSETATNPATKAQATTKGTFVTVYKPQADGSWKAIWDIATPGAAAATQAAAK